MTECPYSKRRVDRIASHLQLPQGQEQQIQLEFTSAAAVPSQGFPTAEEIARSFIDRNKLSSTLEDRTKLVDLSQLVPGPLDDTPMFDVRLELYKSFLTGQNMLVVERWAHKYGKNIVFPMTITPRGEMPYHDWLVTVGDPEDVDRILRNHAKKSHIYGAAFLGDGVLSTRDNDLWMAQRKHLQEAFLPNTALKTQVFPKSYARAKYAARERMRDVLKSGQVVVEMNEFLLHEAMAQLQLALIGETEEEMNRFNIPLRRAHENSLKMAIESFDEAMTRRRQARKTILDFSDQVLSHCPQGVLGQRLVDNCPLGKDDRLIKRDTVSTFNFAGYDTTGNLMTWTLYELSRTPAVQDRVRKEIDVVYSQLAKENRELSYEDLQKFPFLSRVITETLRLCKPSVPNGTFRELEHDEQIKGKGGKMVTLPKGTQLSIPVWLLHSSEELWGPTVEEFNPDRDFLPQEVWNGQALAAWNPQSHRYMPFTSAPRDCIGKNFAQMEARVILIELLRHYEFTLAEPTLSASKTGRVRDERFIAFNAGTMAPKNGIHLNVAVRKHLL